MIETPSYRNAFFIALLIHVMIAFMLVYESATSNPVLKAETKKGLSQPEPMEMTQQQQAIKAVSVDNQEVMKAVNRLKQERVQQQQAEQKRQKTLALQAEQARQQRIAEQKRVEKLKNEAAKLAKAHEQKLAEEQLRLKQLAKQKQEEQQRLQEMKKQQEALKKQQQQEAQKLAEMKKLKDDELERANQARAAKAKEELAQKQKAAAMAAQKNALLAGEVDKYKALIIGAISRQWILPENVDSALSSQFRIRLAPNGAVLEVNLTRSSGDPILDRSAQAAIYKASPLPVPHDPETFNLFRDISLTVRPENARG